MKISMKNKQNFSSIQHLRLLWIFIFIFSASLSMHSQITINVKNEPIRQIIKTIEKKSGYKFFFNDDFTTLNKVTSLNVNNTTIDNALKILFSGTDISWEKKDKNLIVLTPIKASNQDPTQTKSNTHRVSGVVTDENGESLIGVNVKEAGYSNGTITDINGNFSLTLSNSNAILFFSYIGYTQAKIQVKNQSVLKIQLTPEVKALTEVVVTALGIRKEAKSLSYNVQQVSGNDLNKVADASFVNNLNGKVAGISINSAASGVGGSSRVVMRGVKSLSTGSSNALYVVDGVPMLNFEQSQAGADVFSGAGQSGDVVASINPDDIESLSVLSGPSAAALYGSSAANGVVVITTKKGKKDTFSVSMSNSTQFSHPLLLPKLQTTYGPTTIGSFSSWGDKLPTASTYDVADFFQTGVNVSNNVSISTGTEKNQTYLSLGSVNSEGIIHNNNFDRYNFSVRNTSSFLNNKMTMDISLTTSAITEQNMISQGLYSNPLVSLYLFPAGEDFSKVQVYERYNPSRNFQTQYWPYTDMGLSLQNPYWITEHQKFINHKYRYSTTGSLKYEFAKWINLSVRGKFDQNFENYEKKFDASTLNLLAGDYGYYSLNEVQYAQTYVEALLSINKYFGKNISLTANLGSIYDHVVRDQNMTGGKLSIANMFSLQNIYKTDAEYSQSGGKKEKQSLFGSTQIGYKSMVYLDATLRYDWSSTFAFTNTKYYSYPSIGLSGIFSEMFNLNKDLIPFLKGRVSYSEVGNDPLEQITSSTYPVSYGNLNTFGKALYNNSFQPERTKSWEAGVNLILFKNKLKIDATGYNSKTYNQFFDVSIPSSTNPWGASHQYINGANVTNKGIELSVKFDQKFGKLLWNSYATFSMNKNKVSDISELHDPTTGAAINFGYLSLGGNGSYVFRIYEGGSANDVYVNTLKTDVHGEVIVNSSDYSVQANVNNYIYAGNTDPKYRMSWGNTFSWKGLSLNALLSFRYGGIVISNTQAILDAFGASQATADARDNGGAIVNGKPVPAQAYYNIAGQGGGTSGGIGSLYCYSATNLRLSEVSLGYDIPVNKIYKWVKGINVSLVGKNLFLIYNKAPFDPETTASTGTYYQGVDYFMQPSLRTIGFSVKFQF